MNKFEQFEKDFHANQYKTYHERNNKYYENLLENAKYTPAKYVLELSKWKKSGDVYSTKIEVNKEEGEIVESFTAKACLTALSLKMI